MSKVSRTLDNLFDGVSRRPQTQRLPSHADEQTNALSLYNFSLARRPPMEHLAKLMASTTGYETAFVEEIRRSDTEEYVFIIINGDLKVFSVATGAEISVEFPDAKAYLTGATNGFRSVTIGDSTVIVNRSKVTEKGTTKSAVTPKEALLYVKQGDYKTKYIAVLDGNTVTHETPATGRELIATDYIATELRTKLLAIAAVNNNYTITRYGSALHIVNKISSAYDFALTANDGLGDKALLAIKGTVQRFSDLPTKAKAGFTVEVKGDESTEFDNYFVAYQEPGTPGGAGVWKEVAQPDSIIAFDKATMPHRLAYQGNYLGREVPQGAVHTAPAVTAGTHVNGGAVFTGQVITVFSGTVYAPGAAIVVSVESGAPANGTFSFTNSTGVYASAETMCEGLRLLVDASPDWVAVSLTPNTFEIWGAVDVVFTASARFSYDSTRRFCNSVLGMATNVHVGRTIKNLTDGSAAVILTNGAYDFYTVAALTGGADNRFDPGDLISVVGTGGYFTFGQIPWTDRAAGTEAVIPFPSFIGSAITHVFEHQGRLGFLSGPNGVLSQAGADNQFNLFRQTATQLLADDVIDFKSVLSSSPSFDSAANWNGTLLLKSDEGLFELRGEPVLSPTTVSLTKIADYQSVQGLPPAILGSSVFFVGMRSNVPLVWDLRIRGREQKAIAEDTTHHVPAYIDGVPLQLEADDTSSILFLRTDDDRGVFFVYVCHYEGGEKVQSAWSKWDVGGDAQIIAINSIRGRLIVTTKHSDGIYLHSIVLDTSENPAALLTPVNAWWCNGAYDVGGTPLVM